MTEDVRALLERAESTAEGRGRSAVTTESVYAQVAGVRRRRRTLLAGAVAAVIVAGAAAVPLSDRFSARPDAPEILAKGQSPGDSAGAARAQRIGALLDKDLDGLRSVTRVRDAPFPTSHRKTPDSPPDWGDASTGPLDGHYLITREVDGKTVTTGLSVAYAPPATTGKATMKDRITEVKDCVTTDSALKFGCRSAPGPGGTTVYTWQGGYFFGLGGALWTKFEDQRLRIFPDGGALLVADGADLAWGERHRLGGTMQDMGSDKLLAPLGAEALTALVESPETVPRKAVP
ncbi:hypothetical protein ACWDR0_12640 [Streptomyces sp. NPDC003691]